MINKENVQRVNKMVEEAIAAGAKVIVRGGPVTEGALSEGAFYRPTLLEVTDPGLPIVQQEIFGPVATLQVFDTEEETISLANNSEYGLAASIWTRDIDRPWRVAKAIQAGTIWINTYAQIFAQFEEGGYKMSGNGRLNGEAALEDFLEYKHISFNPGVSDFSVNPRAETHVPFNDNIFIYGSQYFFAIIKQNIHFSSWRRACLMVLEESCSSYGIKRV